MGEPVDSQFFRPWNVSGNADVRHFNENVGTDKASATYKTNEEDEDSLLSSTTCTAEEGSSAAFSENEAFNMSRLNVNLSDDPVHLRHRRQSQASSTSSSAKSEESEKSSPDVLQNFVLGHGSTYPPQIPVEAQMPGTSMSSPGMPYVYGRSAFQPVYPEFVQAGVHYGHFPGGPSTSNYFLPPVQNIGGNVPPMCYGLPMQRPLDQQLYGSVEHAVELIHRQDAAAKQMKKLRPKKFRCEHCDVAFSNNGQLKGHIRIHTGERPFKCDAENCGKSFTRNEELTRHKRIHTGLRPHACLICGKCFGRKDHLKKHTRTHENRDPYRVSAALGMLAFGHPLQRPPMLPPYMYPM